MYEEIVLPVQFPQRNYDFYYSILLVFIKRGSYQIEVYGVVNVFFSRLD